MMQTRSLISCICVLSLVQPIVAQPTVGVSAPARTGANSYGAVNWLTKNYRGRDVAPIRLNNSGRLESLIRAGNLYLSLKDAVALAIENNLDVELQRYGPEQAQASLLRAQAGGLLRGQTTAVAAGPTSALNQVLGNTGGGGGANGTANVSAGTTISATGTTLPNLDAVFSSNMSFGHSSRPQANTITSGGLAAVLVNSQSYQNAITKGWVTGTTAQLSWNMTSAFSNSPGPDLNVSRSGSFQLNVTQRLLQGFGIAVNSRNINVAKNNVNVADLQFELQVITIVAAVQNLYWDLVSFNSDFRVKQSALDLARKLYEDNQKQVEIGTLAPIEVVSAKAAMAARQQDLTLSETALLQQEIIIKNALSRTGTLSPTISDARVIPTDSIQIPDTDMIRPIQDLYEEAKRNRPEIMQSVINVENSNINIAGSRSQLRPSLDVTGSFANNGLSGAVNPFTIDPTRPHAPDQYFIGSYGNLLNQLFRRNFPDYSLQFSLNVPIRNRSAQADLLLDTLNLRQQELNQQKQLNQLRVDVQNAVISMRQARARHQSAVEQRELQAQTLDAEQKKYALGASTAFFVIQYQTQLAQAQSNEVAAEATYAKAQVELGRVTGSTLKDSDVEISEARAGRVTRAPDPIPAQAPKP